MPLLASPFTSVPPGVSRPADPVTAAQAAQILGIPGDQGVAAIPPGFGVPPGLADLVQPPTQPQTAGDREELDLLQRVVRLVMDPESRQLKPEWILILAGMGLREALEKSGKYREKPHRSNEELARLGYDVGIPGQTGLASPDQLRRQVSPSELVSRMPGF